MISSGWEKVKEDAWPNSGVGILRSAEELWGQAEVIVGHQAEEQWLDACFSEQVKWEMCSSERNNQ